MRAEHRSLWAADDPIATTSNWADWRGPSTLGFLVLGFVAWALLHARSLDPYAGIALVAAGAPFLPEAVTFWIQRLRSGRPGGFRCQPGPGTLDQFLALVPLGLVVLGVLV